MTELLPEQQEYLDKKIAKLNQLRNFSILRLLLKLIEFFGTVLLTVGFLTFFFWESLESNRWAMILSGLIVISIIEAIDWPLKDKFDQSKQEYDDEFGEESG